MIYLATDQETRATTNRVMAAIEGFIGWMLLGPRQHDSDRLSSLGTLPRYAVGETSRETGAAK